MRWVAAMALLEVSLNRTPGDAWVRGLQKKMADVGEAKEEAALGGEGGER